MYNPLRSSRNPSTQLFVFIRYKEGELLPLRVSSNYSSDLCVDLLLLSNGQFHHYVLITDLMRVVEYVRGKLHQVETTFAANASIYVHQSIHYKGTRKCATKTREW